MAKCYAAKSALKSIGQWSAEDNEILIAARRLFDMNIERVERKKAAEWVGSKREERVAEWERGGREEMKSYRKRSL